MYTSCKKTCRCITDHEINTPTGFIPTSIFQDLNTVTFNMQMYRTIISTLITCNQFIAMVQVGYITRFGLYSPRLCKSRIDLHLIITYRHNIYDVYYYIV